MNGRYDIYKYILEAVQPLEEVQLVLSIGKNINPENLGPIPSNSIVVQPFQHKTSRFPLTGQVSRLFDVNTQRFD